MQSLKLKPATSRISDSQAFQFSRKSHITLRSKETQHQFQFQDLLNSHQVHPFLHPWTSKAKDVKNCSKRHYGLTLAMFSSKNLRGFRSSHVSKGQWLVSMPILSNALSHRVFSCVLCLAPEIPLHLSSFFASCSLPCFSRLSSVALPTLLE